MFGAEESPYSEIMIKGNRKKSPVERQPETEKPIKLNTRFLKNMVILFP